MTDNKPSAVGNGAPASHTYNAQHPPTLARESSSSSMRRTESSTRPSAHTLQSSTSTASSASASPFASREASPTRPSARLQTNMRKTAATATAIPSTAAATTSTTPPISSTSTSTAAATATPNTRSRRNSQQDPSPSRASRSGLPTPTPTAAQRTATLSTATTPTLLPAAASDASTTRATGPQKSEQPRDAPRWPISPRLRSPPPLLNRPGAAPATAVPSPLPSPSLSNAPSPSLTATASSAAPTISLQRSAPPSPAAETASAASYAEADDAQQVPSGMRTPVRGAVGNAPTLETVQEASPLGSPKAFDAALEKLEVSSVVSDAAATTSTTPEVAEVSPVKAIRAKQLASQNQAESGSESGGGTKASRRTAAITPAAAAAAAAAPPPLTSRQSSTSRAALKGKSGEGSQPTMTVETETVTSIPNVALGPAAVQNANGSLRTKPSSETIRPKKEKKKSTRKQTAVAPGTATSKADIFEAKVASAVDEANTSDSEETFVYDSNPADNRDRPHRFHHSRTPSATSLAPNDRNGMRSIHSILEGPGPSVAMKKSMKFVNTFVGNSSGNDSGLGDDESKGATVRGGAPGSGRGTARLHHHVGAGGSHIGRWGLSGPKNGHPSILDNESPFPVLHASSSSRLKLPVGGGGGDGTNNSGGPGLQSMGSANLRSSGTTLGGRAKRGYGTVGNGKSALGYDMDDTTPGVADDEGTSLLPPSSSGMRGAGRSGRSARRQQHMSLRALEQQQAYHHPGAGSFLNRFASCLVLTVMIMLVISGAIGFMFATSQPLEDIELIKISGVIASEQELMFDLMVRAHNPNVVVVTVDAADMEVFAKSPHAGTDSEWWRRPHGAPAVAATVGTETKTGTNTVTVTDTDTDLAALDNEPRDQPNSSPNFLLGNVTTFDNPLSFEGSFFHHGLSTSRSGVRLRRPGNGTDGGSERWERILEDEFDLIIKGVLRYSLPLSQRVRSALIKGRTTVKPNAADDPSHHPNGTASISGV